MLFRKVWLTVSLLLFHLALCQSQVVKLNSVASSSGDKDEIYRYAFKGYHCDSSCVVINMNDSIIYNGKDQYSIIEMPKCWHVKRKYKYCMFLCYNNNFDKVFVKFTRYDGNFNRSKISIYTDTHATLFIGNECK